ncbi:hypothetical protein D3273_14160 [Lichenibacterium minor]|uniref:PIN domain-containing protein n=1 Tax=Lichenibacterium minor TaxID=2316528 RepID=A0A4Q2U5Z7_9HYPH|nr:hypothetical protein [Lichenibacterium minor]RYC31258.1 hypothetical protein D3273_14160 [Lichenibacterium minor]
MAEPALVDNDVVLKLCCYGYHESLGEAVGHAAVGMLSIARHVLRDAMRRSRSIAHRDKVVEALEGAFASSIMLVVDEAELALATEFAERAARVGVDLDTGEAQLLAILLSRAAPLLVTGDKRAVMAIAELGLTGAHGRVACLEQVLAALVDLHGTQAVRAAVCAEPAVDRAATTCFACSADTVSEEDVRAGLESYVGDLRRRGGPVLVGFG